MPKLGRLRLPQKTESAGEWFALQLIECIHLPYKIERSQ
jgi:hypothetical protein